MGTKYLPHIDGLRAVAVLSVVAYHAGLPLPGGFVGVDVFFVISGFLITGLLAKEWRETGRIDLAAFYARRIRRILPALAFVVSVTLLLGAWLLSTGQQHALARSAVASMAMVGNVFFQVTTGDYFASAADEMPLLHLWSLGVEEQFYVVWPLLLAWLLRHQRPLIIGGVLAVASLALAHIWMLNSIELAFFHMPSRFWELVLGGMLALHRPRWGRWAAYAGAGLLLIAIVAPAPNGFFPGIGALPAVAGAVLLIASHDLGPVGRLLTLRPIIFVGLISYSLYLWHWPLLALHRASTLATPEAWESVSLCLLSGALAWLTYRFIEQPFRSIRAPNSRLIFAGVTTSVAVALMAGGLGLHSESIGSKARRITLDRADRSCYVQQPHLAPVPAACWPKNAKVVLWGDSHAHAWLPFAQSFGPVAQFTMSACAPALGWSIDHATNRRHRSVCNAFNADAVNYIGRGTDTVIIATKFQLHRFAAIEGIARSVAAVAPHSRQVLLMAPLPRLKKPAADCIESGLACGMSRTEFTRFAAPFNSALNQIAGKYPNVTVVDPGPFFCEGARCPVQRDGMPLFWDDDHISESAARRFANLFHQRG